MGKGGEKKKVLNKAHKVLLLEKEVTRKA